MLHNAAVNMSQENEALEDEIAQASMHRRYNRAVVRSPLWQIFGEIPQDVAYELAKLDRNEVSTALTRSNGQTLVFLMLCGRTPALAEDQDRESIRLQLRAQRLQSYAEGYLAQLKADARIIEQ